MRDSSTLSRWLAGIGLERYAERLAANDIDLDVVPYLTEVDLEQLGISLGDRKRLLRAVERDWESLGESTRAEALAEKQAERRQLTILFCDLVGYTDLSRRLDPEELRDLVVAYQSTCTLIFRRYGGFVSRYVGDGILVYFGYEKVAENEAERAVYAGLEVVEAMHTLPEKSGLSEIVEVAVRIAISTGTVLVGNEDEANPNVERQAVIGATPNLAARLQSIAPPNSVVVSESTHALIARLFKLRDLGHHQLKGFPQPVRAWQVISHAEFDARFEALRPANLAPLVGRAAEMALLHQRWEHMRETSQGGGILITGEAGIGKSRILHDFARVAATADSKTIRLQCSDLHANDTLFPVRRLLLRAARIHSDAPWDGVLAKLSRLLGSSRGRSPEDIELIARSLFAELAPPEAAQRPSSANELRLRMKGLLEALLDLAHRRALLVIVEDVHWADRSTLELLNQLLDRILDHRILVLLTSRPEFSPPWGERDYMVSMSLGRLTRGQCDLLAQAVAKGKRLPNAVRQAIFANTGGVPLFAEEVTKTVLSSGTLEERRDHYLLPRGLPELTVPLTLKDSLEARLEHLGEAKTVARVAAVIGKEFSAQLIAELLSKKVKDVSGHLVQLLEAGILYRRKPQNGSLYAFRHALLQEAAYQGLLRSRRKSLHARLAELLGDSSRMERPVPELLAFHLERAGRDEAAQFQWVEAARRALDRGGYAEAIVHLLRASALLDKFPPGRKRTERQLEVALLLGTARRVVLGFSSPEIRETFGLAAQLADQIEDKAALVSSSRGLWMCHLARGELEAARELANRVLALGRDGGERDAIGLGNWMLGTVQFWGGEFCAARECLEASMLATKRRGGNTQPASARYPLINSLSYLAWTLAMLGESRASAKVSAKAIRRARDLNDPFNLATALIFSACLRLPHPREGRDRELLKEAHTLCTTYDFMHWHAICELLIGQDSMALRPSEQKLGLIELACHRLREEGAAINLPWALQIHADAACQLGRRDQGARLLDEAIGLARETGAEHWMAELLRRRGELLQDAGHRKRAEHHFRLALEIAQTQGAKVHELRAATSLCRYLRARAKEAEARATIDAALAAVGRGAPRRELMAAKEERTLLRG